MYLDKVKIATKLCPCISQCLFYSGENQFHLSYAQTIERPGVNSPSILTSRQTSSSEEELTVLPRD
jgi:hypothetical protein